MTNPDGLLILLDIGIKPIYFAFLSQNQCFIYKVEYSIVHWKYYADTSQTTGQWE